MRKQSKSPDGSATAVGFLRWLLESGKPQAELRNYVPATLVEQVEQFWQHNCEALTASAAAPGRR